MGLVGELGLELTAGVATLVVTGDFESNIVGLGGDLDSVASERVVLAQEIFGGLSKVL